MPTKHRKDIRWLLACSAFLLAGASGLANAVEPVFEPVPMMARLAASAPNDRALSTLQSQPSTLAIHEVRAKPALIDQQNQQLMLPVGGSNLLVEQDYSYQNADGTIVWSGTLGGTRQLQRKLGRFGNDELASDLAESVMLVRNGNKLTGTIRSGRRLFKITPLRNGHHAIVEVDESALPPAHPSRPLPQAPWMLRRNDQSRTKAAITAADRSLLKVGVLFTEDAIYQTNDPQGLAQLAVAETNQGYLNSGIDITMELVGVVGYYPGFNSGDFHQDLERFQGTNDGHIDGWHGYRNEIGADLSVLITTTNTYCGLGYLLASAEWAFSVVNVGCLTGTYTFAHETGHNIGAMHDPDNGVNTVYPYGHGFQHPRGMFRTVMAYDCPGRCPQINAWSNPYFTHWGEPMGSHDRHNNTRLLNERRAIVSSFR